MWRTQSARLWEATDGLGHCRDDYTCSEDGVKEGGRGDSREAAEEAAAVIRSVSAEEGRSVEWGVIAGMCRGNTKDFTCA